MVYGGGILINYNLIGDGVSLSDADGVAEEPESVLCFRVFDDDCIAASVNEVAVVDVDAVVQQVVEVDRVATEGFDGDGVNVFGRCTGREEENPY